MLLFFFMFLAYEKAVAENNVPEKVITVSKNGTADFRTIQSAVNAVRDQAYILR